MRRQGRRVRIGLTRKSLDVGGELLGQQADEIPDLLEPPAADITDRPCPGAERFERHGSVFEGGDVDRVLEAYGRELAAAAPHAAGGHSVRGVRNVGGDGGYTARVRDDRP